MTNKFVALFYILLLSAPTLASTDAEFWDSLSASLAPVPDLPDSSDEFILVNTSDFRSLQKKGEEAEARVEELEAKLAEKDQVLQVATQLVRQAQSDLQKQQDLTTEVLQALANSEMRISQLKQLLAKSQQPIAEPLPQVTPTKLSGKKRGRPPQTQTRQTRGQTCKTTKNHT